MESVEQLDFATLTLRTEGPDRCPDVVRYATGADSSRKIATACYDSVAFRYIAANSHPDHDTRCTLGAGFWDVAQLLHWAEQTDKAEETHTARIRSAYAGLRSGHSSCVRTA